MKLFGFKNFDELLAFNCAPVLTGIKVANLICIQPYTANELNALVEEYNERFAAQGIVFRAFRTYAGHWLLLIYRPALLQQILTQPGYQAYLIASGYTAPEDMERSLNTLGQHLLTEKDFPHEIGVFLGYPLEDIIGFALHRGKNCKYSGYWKVYGDVEKAHDVFAAYERCRDFILDKLHAGLSLIAACNTF